MATANTKTCPYCKSAIPADASHCAHCGKNVSTLDRMANNLFIVGCSILLVAGCLIAIIMILV